jgi:hypothetical protein
MDKIHKWRTPRKSERSPDSESADICCRHQVSDLTLAHKKTVRDIVDIFVFFLPPPANPRRVNMKRASQK